MPFLKRTGPATAVDDAIKKAINTISKSLETEHKPKKSMQEVFNDHVANSPDVDAASAVTAAAIAKTLVDMKDKDENMKKNVEGKIRN